MISSRHRPLNSRAMRTRLDFYRGRDRYFERCSTWGSFMARIYVTDTRRLDRRHSDAAPSGMSYDLPYNLRLQCGCVIYVSSDHETGFVPTRVIQSRGAAWISSLPSAQRGPRSPASKDSLFLSDV
jgi:hypothetical protein